METWDIIDVFLQPGDYFVGDGSYRVRTLLGSCVSITLWDPHTGIGAMSHFLLPGRSGEVMPDARYGEDALDLMLAGLHGHGVRADDCVAKIFGGGNMFPARQRNRCGIGGKNGEEARRLLGERGIRIEAESLYGSGHRQVMFEIATGDVWARQFSAKDAA